MTYLVLCFSLWWVYVVSSFFFTFTEVTFLETPIAHVPFIYWARMTTVRHSSAQSPMLHVCIAPHMYVSWILQFYSSSASKCVCFGPDLLLVYATSIFVWEINKLGECRRNVLGRRERMISIMQTNVLGRERNQRLG